LGGGIAPRDGLPTKPCSDQIPGVFEICYLRRPKFPTSSQQHSTAHRAQRNARPLCALYVSPAGDDGVRTTETRPSCGDWSKPASRLHGRLCVVEDLGKASTG